MSIPWIHSPVNSDINILNAIFDNVDLPLRSPLLRESLTVVYNDLLKI